MCHRSVRDWVAAAVRADEVSGRSVLEVGALDVNGSVRPCFERHRPGCYLGVDIAPGPGVDRVLDCEQLVAVFGPQSWDVVVTSEMLEHVVDWVACVRGMVEVLRPGGLWFVTTRSPGFPYHPFPIDSWRYTVDDFADICAVAGLQTVDLVADPQDPGVFCKARKPMDWAGWAGELSQVAISPMEEA